MIRMREFNMAEVEFFYDEAGCEELQNVMEERLNLLTNKNESLEVSVSDALGLVENMNLLYFIALTKNFLYRRA